MAEQNMSEENSSLKHNKSGDPLNRMEIYEQSQNNQYSCPRHGISAVNQSALVPESN